MCVSASYMYVYVHVLLAVRQPCMTVYMSVNSGQAPADVEILFLKKASSLDTYGVDPHPVKVSVVT